MAERIDIICHDLFKAGTITFNEWVVISAGVTDYVPAPCLPVDYTDARAALLKEQE